MSENRQRSRQHQTTRFRRAGSFFLKALLAGASHRKTMHRGLLFFVAFLCVLMPAVSAQGQSVAFTNLHSFNVASNGANPYAALVQGSDGNFYGTTSSGGTNGWGTVFKITANGALTTLYSFTGGVDGANPYAALVLGSDGSFFGTTYTGGDTNGDGTVFRITATGTLTSLCLFTNGVDGANPQAGLALGSDGNFYGTTSGGGTNGRGTVFKITAQGALTTLHSFTNGVDGANPQAGLALGSDGNFYGTTCNGGTKNFGAVFKITSAGALTPLYSFTGGVDGANPYAALVLGANGNFYGTTFIGGAHGYGTVFKITSTGALSPLYSFTGGVDGANPYAALVLGTNGNFYGTTEYGASDNGTVFEITSTGALTPLYSFTGGSDGDNPRAGLVLGTNGNFYGTTSVGTNSVGAVFEITSTGTLTSLYSFIAANDGANPAAGLVLGSDGSFFGTTYNGGTNDYGTVFKMTSTGALTPLYSFTNGIDGANPAAGLVLGSDGSFFGTTYDGGTSNYGTVFEITTDGALSPLYSFTGGNDGAYPEASLVQGSDGSFFGTTYTGGDTNGDGTVFKITATGTLTPLYSFIGGNDGANPAAGLVQGSDGNFYGTTYDDGADGVGTVFKITTDGTLATLYSFTGTNDGANPQAGLALGSDGNFYGTTSGGGTNDVGTVFEITTGGTLTTLYSFGGSNDGGTPLAGLVLGSDGNFYGTTPSGGTNGAGTVFKITPNGVLTTLYSFTGGNDGGNPQAGLVQGSAGNFYGTTAWGGAGQSGVVFRVTVPLPPLIAITNPVSGAQFTLPVNINLNVSQSDPNANGNVTQVAFFTNNNPLAVTTSSPFSFVWTDPPAGTYVLIAVAANNLGLSATSAPVNVTVSAPPVFQFSAANYSVNESSGSVTLTVVNTGTLGATVNYETLDGTAMGGAGSSGEYTITSGHLTFPNGQTAAAFSIPIIDNFVDEPDIYFQAQLFNPTAGTLGNPSVATVTIHLNDAGAATNSLVSTVFPTAQPPMTASLTIVLTPPEAAGQWRFPWDLGWRTNGQTVSGLVAGSYPVEIRTLPGWLPIPPALTNLLSTGANLTVTNTYYPTGTSSDPDSIGSLTVNFGAGAPAGAGWQFIGDTTWQAPGATVGSLLPGIYFVQFEPVTGYSPPASATIGVFGGQNTTVTENYQLAQTPPASVTSFPQQIRSDYITDYGDYAFGFNGQLQTDVGFGSGVAVRESVVLTAAHMVFNDQTEAYVNNAWWSFQEESNVFQPEPLAARGWYVLAGYAGQRSNDLANGYGPDESSPQSRDLDVAALYFLTPAARTGYGGYLASDAIPNPYLVGTSNKFIVGYPVDGSVFGSNVSPGLMYATPPLRKPFVQANDQVYTAAWCLSYPGNSGGPVYVQYQGEYYYPAAVYLGTLYSNGVPAASAVRAIDSNVVSLISLAAIEGDSGTNNSGGGVLTIIPNQTINAANPGYVQFQLEPPAAVAAGAAWKLTGGSYSTANNFTEPVTGTVTVQFKPIAGWILPTNQTISVAPNQIRTNLAFYAVSNPAVVVNASHALGLTGTAGTVYQIQSRTNLTSGVWTPVSTNTITNSGFNLVSLPPTNRQPATFFRALWLP